MKLIIIIFLILSHNTGIMAVYEFLGFQMNGTLEENVNRFDRSGINILKDKNSNYWGTKTIRADNVPNKLSKSFIDVKKYNDKDLITFYYFKGGYVEYTFYLEKNQYILKKVQINTQRRLGATHTYTLYHEFCAALDNSKKYKMRYKNPYAKIRMNFIDFPYAFSKASGYTSVEDEEGNNYFIRIAPWHWHDSDEWYLTIMIVDQAYSDMRYKKEKAIEDKKIDKINL